MKLSSTQFSITLPRAFQNIDFRVAKALDPDSVSAAIAWVQIVGKLEPVAGQLATGGGQSATSDRFSGINLLL